MTRMGVSRSWLLLSFVCCTANASGETGPPSSLEVDATAMPCALALPGSIAVDLNCPDKLLAIREINEAKCFLPNSPGAMEVRKAWLARESLAADAAGRDPVVEAFMAICLVESIRGASVVGPVEASAVAFLRQALNEPGRGIAGIAMAGLSAVLIKEDVTTIVRLGSTQSELTIPAIAALSASCIPEAKAGVTSIRAAYAGTQQQLQIDRFLDGSKDFMEHCGREGMSSSKALPAQTHPTPPALGVSRIASPDAAQVRTALNSTNDKSALQTLLDVKCGAGNGDVVEEMRKAWRGRGTAGGGLVSDPVAQAVIASCLIQADSAARGDESEIREAAGVLRSAIHSDNSMAVAAAVEGLAIIAADEDVKPIAEVSLRIPGLLNWSVRALGFTCGASNLKTLALMRKEAATDKVRDQIDTVYKRVAPVREQTCSKNN